MEQVTVSAVRGNHVAGEWIVEVTFELEGAVLSIVKGGVTGFEGFYVDGRSEEVLKKMGLGHLPIAQGHCSDVIQVGWTACGGTKGRWDSLYVPAASMQAVAEHFGLWQSEES